MFIYSLRASTLKLFGILMLAVTLLISLVFLVPPMNAEAVDAEAKEIKYEKVKTNEDRVAFLASLGLEVQAEPCEEEEIKIPSEFDRIFAAYNEIQRSQGLNLAKYAGRRAKRYSYEVKNFGTGEKVLASLIVYKNRVIAGDICSAENGGYVLPLNAAES